MIRVNWILIKVEQYHNVIKQIFWSSFFKSDPDSRQQTSPFSTCCFHFEWKVDGSIFTKLSKNIFWSWLWVRPGNTKGGSITVPLTSCLTGLESAVWQLTIFLFICKTDESKAVKQELNGTVIRPPLVFLGITIQQSTNDLSGNDIEPKLEALTRHLICLNLN